LTSTPGTDLLERPMSPDKQTLDELRIDRRPAPANRSRTLVIVLALAVVAVVVAVVSWLNRPQAAAVRTILVQETGSGGQKTLLNASGYVTARRQATVSSKVTGKVIEVLVEEGMKVEAGQILARIDSSNVEKSLNLAEAHLDVSRKALDETKANLEQAERELARFVQLAANKVASQSDLDRAEAEAKSLRARLERQKADIVVSERAAATRRHRDPRSVCGHRDFQKRAAGRDDFTDVGRRQFHAHRHLHTRGHEFAGGGSGRERELHQPR
jgi:multidrug efflux pump subunit AcrA (membrane-fusion protein)